MFPSNIMEWLLKFTFTKSHICNVMRVVLLAPHIMGNKLLVTIHNEQNILMQIGGYSCLDRSNHK